MANIQQENVPRVLAGVEGKVRAGVRAEPKRKGFGGRGLEARRGR